MLRTTAPLRALNTAAMQQVLTIIVMGSQVSRLRGELQKADAINGHQKDDNVRLQVSMPVGQLTGIPVCCQRCGRAASPPKVRNEPWNL